MNMKKLTTLLLTATLGLASGAALAADTGAQSNNGQPTLPRMPVRWRRMPVRTWPRTTWTIVRSTLALGAPRA